MARAYRKGTTNRSCVYCITNIVTGHRYIGSTKDLAARWSHHRQSLHANRHSNQYLQRAWNKYGADAFTFTVLEDCDTAQLIERENEWIDLMQSNTRSRGYNLRITAGTSAGVTLSEETRLRMSEAKRGYKQSPEHAANQCAARRGAKRSEQQKARMSESRRQHSPETVKQIIHLLDTVTEWGKTKKIAEIVGVSPRYVQRISSYPPKWTQRLNDATT